MPEKVKKNHLQCNYWSMIIMAKNTQNTHQDQCDLLIEIPIWNSFNRKRTMDSALNRNLLDSSEI